MGHAGVALDSVAAEQEDLKIYGTIEAWRNRPIEGEHLYVYLDGIVLKRSWAGEVRNVSSKCSKRQTCIDPFADRIADNSP